MKRILLILLFLCATAQAQYAGLKPILGQKINWGHPLSKGLVGCWLMNEGSGNRIYDLTGNLSPATVNCANPWNPPYGTIHGSALYFNSADNDYVNLGKPVVGTEFSIVLWVRGTGPGGWNADDGYMIGDSTDFANLFFRWTSLGTDSITLGIGEDSLGASTSLTQIWHCYVITHGNSGTEAFLYEDGIVINSDTAFASNFNGFTSDVWLGNRVGLDRALDAQISTCMIYNRILTASEARQLYYEPFCIFDQTNYALLNSVTGVPAPGQVIFIQMSTIPLLLILTITIAFRIKTNVK